MLHLFSGPFVFHTQAKNHQTYKNEILSKIILEYDENKFKDEYLWTPTSKSGVKTNYSNMNFSLLTTDQYKDIVWDSVEKLISHLYSEYSPIKPSNNPPSIYDCDISSIWWNIYASGDYVELHNHCPAGVSGIYLIDLPEDTKNTTVFVHNNDYALSHNVQMWSQKHIADYAKEGDVILFPSSMYHYVNASSGRKVSISFNVNINFKNSIL
jgi:uncharacterized protein (TIGR02466 family)